MAPSQRVVAHRSSVLVDDGYSAWFDSVRSWFAVGPAGRVKWKSSCLLFATLVPPSLPLYKVPSPVRVILSMTSQSTRYSWEVVCFNHPVANSWQGERCIIIKELFRFKTSCLVHAFLPRPARLWLLYSPNDASSASLRSLSYISVGSLLRFQGLEVLLTLVFFWDVLDCLKVLSSVYGCLRFLIHEHGLPVPRAPSVPLLVSSRPLWCTSSG